LTVRNDLGKIRFVVEARPFVEQNVRRTGVDLGYFHVTVSTLVTVRLDRLFDDVDVGGGSGGGVIFVVTAVVVFVGVVGERRRLRTVRLLRVVIATFLALLRSYCFASAQRRAAALLHLGGGLAGVGEDLATRTVVVAVPVAVRVARVGDVVASVQHPGMALQITINKYIPRFMRQESEKDPSAIIIRGMKRHPRSETNPFGAILNVRLFKTQLTYCLSFVSLILCCVV
jgi:hypothetical protein